MRYAYTRMEKKMIPCTSSTVVSPEAAAVAEWAISDTICLFSFVSIWTQEPWHSFGAAKREGLTFFFFFFFFGQTTGQGYVGGYIKVLGLRIQKKKERESFGSS